MSPMVVSICSPNKYTDVYNMYGVANTWASLSVVASEMDWSTVYLTLH